MRTVTITFAAASQAERAFARARRNAYYARGHWRHVRGIRRSGKTVTLTVISHDSAALALAERLPVVLGAPGRVEVR